MYRVYSFKEGKKVIEKDSFENELKARQFVMWCQEIEWLPPLMWVEEY